MYDTKPDNTLMPITPISDFGDLAWLALKSSHSLS